MGRGAIWIHRVIRDRCADPEGFLRRIDDFTPLESELVELAALRSELEELVTRDRAHMRSKVRNSDPVEVYDVLQRSKRIDGLQSEWDLLSAHFQGLRRVAFDELQGLLRETMPSQRSSDLRKYDVFGEDAKACGKIPRFKVDVAFVQNNRVLLERRQHEQPYPQRQMIGIARVRVLPQGSVQFDKAHDRSFLKNFTLEKQATNRDPGHSCYARGAASGLSSHPPGQIALNARS